MKWKPYILFDWLSQKGNIEFNIFYIGTYQEEWYKGFCIRILGLWINGGIEK